MDPIDSIKQFASTHLPRQHLLAASALILPLLALSLLSQNSEKTSTEFSESDKQLSLSAKAIQLSQFSNQTLSLTASLSTDTKTSTTASPAITVEPPSFVTEVRSGDNLSLIFDRAGLSPQDVYKISQSDPDKDILTKLYPGYNLAFKISNDKHLKELEVIKTPLESYSFTLNEQNEFNIEHIFRSPQVEQVFKEAQVQDSLFMAAQRGGISAPITMKIAGIFGGVIDFMLDTRSGDDFNVIYDEKYLNGDFVGNGSIQVAQFTNQGDTFTALRYENLDGDIDYYNPQGESMRKAFLRNPVDFVRISSNFNLSRKHPILNTIRAHKGTDYAAPNGTPVVATSDGRVTWAARNGSFGKLVVIQHGDQFETKYAHLSSYASGIKNGARVKQGQIIGYVGATGGATGPHLHYEFLMNGVHRNARTIHDKLPKAESISADEMQRFKQQTQILLSRLDSFTDEQQSLAQNSHTPTEQE